MTSRGSEKVLSLSFNQDHSKYFPVFEISCSLFADHFFVTILPGCFTCCTDAGIRVHNVEPLSEHAHYGKFIYLVFYDYV